VKLIRVSDQIHSWAENFDHPLQNILDIHSEVGVARSCWNKWDSLRSNLQFRPMVSRVGFSSL